MTTIYERMKTVIGAAMTRPPVPCEADLIIAAGNAVEAHRYEAASLESQLAAAERDVRDLGDANTEMELRAEKAEAVAESFDTQLFEVRAKLAAAESRAVAAEGERDKLRTFKTYVHERLDKAGVPVDPPSEHREHGCRIGGRLDVLIGERDRAREALKKASDYAINQCAEAMQTIHEVRGASHTEIDRLVARKNFEEWKRMSELLSPTPAETVGAKVCGCVNGTHTFVDECPSPSPSPQSEATCDHAIHVDGCAGCERVVEALARMNQKAPQPEATKPAPAPLEGRCFICGDPVPEYHACIWDGSRPAHISCADRWSMLKPAPKDKVLAADSPSPSPSEDKAEGALGRLKKMVDDSSAPVIERAAVAHWVQSAASEMAALKKHVAALELNERDVWMKAAAERDTLRAENQKMREALEHVKRSAWQCSNLDEDTSQGKRCREVNFVGDDVCSWCIADEALPERSKEWLAGSCFNCMGAHVGWPVPTQVQCVCSCHRPKTKPARAARKADRAHQEIRTRVAVEKDRDSLRAENQKMREALDQTGPIEFRRLEAENEALRAWLDGIASTFESAVAHHEQRGAGGQQVGFHGDFANVPPSVVGQMRRWARDVREALSAREGDSK